MANNAKVNVTQLKEDSPTGRGQHNAYLNVSNPYGGIDVWCSVHQIHFLCKIDTVIRFVVFRDEACAQEWLDAQKEKFGDEFEIIEID